MEIKATPQGALIYASLGVHVAALVMALWRRNRPRIAWLLYAVGFAVAVAAYAYRWQHVRHLPMQNLFEVFLTLGVLAFPLSVFCKRILRIDALATDIVLAIIVLFPAGFVFDADPQRLPPALQCWLFAPHVAVYVLAYLLMAKAAVQGAFQLHAASRGFDGLEYEQATYTMVRLGFPLLTLGLILGSWWGKLAWGDWWGWDPKELWSLASWLVYVFYLHWRYMHGRRYARVNSGLAVLGLVVIIITLLWVNLSRLFVGLHNYASS